MDNTIREFIGAHPLPGRMQHVCCGYAADSELPMKPALPERRAKYDAVKARQAAQAAHAEAEALAARPPRVEDEFYSETKMRQAVCHPPFPPFIPFMPCHATCTSLLLYNRDTLSSVCCALCEMHFVALHRLLQLKTAFVCSSAFSVRLCSRMTYTVRICAISHSVVIAGEEEGEGGGSAWPRPSTPIGRSS